MLWQELVLRCQFADVRGQSAQDTAHSSWRGKLSSLLEMLHTEVNTRSALTASRAKEAATHSRPCAVVERARKGGPRKPNVPAPDLPGEVLRVGQIL